MDEQKLTSGEAYTFTLLEEWRNIIINSKEFRFNYLEGRCEPSVINSHISSLINFYEVLKPKVHSHKGEKNWDLLIEEFDSWKNWVDNPTWFQHSGSLDSINELMDILGEVVEKLDITYFPKASGREQ